MKKYISFEDYFKNQTPKPNYKKNKIFKIILITIFLSIIILSSYSIFKWHLNNTKTKYIYKEIEKNFNFNSNHNQGELINPPNNKNSNYYYYASIPFYQVSFSVLSYLNKDTVAFIYLRNTNVKYPIVKSNDNKYYLTHSFDKTQNNAGWIFMDYRNNINNLSENTVIYGHRRLDGTMFGSLKNTLTPKWQNDPNNYVIFLSTLKENMLFQIFSIYTIKQESYYITTNFNNSNEKQKWINIMKKRNISPIDTEVNINDKILTLSTCQNNQDKRIVIHAKLIKKQKITK